MTDCLHRLQIRGLHRSTGTSGPETLAGTHTGSDPCSVGLDRVPFYFCGSRFCSSTCVVPGISADQNTGRIFMYFESYRVQLDLRMNLPGPLESIKNSTSDPFPLAPPSGHKVKTQDDVKL